MRGPTWLLESTTRKEDPTFCSKAGLAASSSAATSEKRMLKNKDAISRRSQDSYVDDKLHKLAERPFRDPLLLPDFASATVVARPVLSASATGCLKQRQQNSVLYIG